MTPLPVELKRIANRGLQILWDDGREQTISLVDLRQACPCATCREKSHAKASRPITMLPVITSAEAQPLTILGMEPVGNYAYQIRFSDGHDSGIFTFEYLYSLSE